MVEMRAIILFSIFLVLVVPIYADDAVNLYLNDGMYNPHDVKRFVESSKNINSNPISNPFESSTGIMSTLVLRTLGSWNLTPVIVSDMDLTSNMIVYLNLRADYPLNEPEIWFEIRVNEVDYISSEIVQSFSMNKVYQLTASNLIFPFNLTGIGTNLRNDTYLNISISARPNAPRDVNSNVFLSYNDAKSRIHFNSTSITEIVNSTSFLGNAETDQFNQNDEISIETYSNDSIGSYNSYVNIKVYNSSEPSQKISDANSTFISTDGKSSKFRYSTVISIPGSYIINTNLIDFAGNKKSMNSTIGVSNAPDEFTEPIFTFDPEYSNYTQSSSESFNTILKNVGNGTLENAQIELVIPEGFTNLSNRVINVGNLSPQSEKDVTWFIKAGNAFGDFIFNVKVSGVDNYSNANVEYTRSYPVTVKQGALFNETQYIQEIGTDVYLNLSINNSGYSDFLDVNASVNFTENIELHPDYRDTYNLGTLQSFEMNNVSWKFIVHGEGNITYHLNGSDSASGIVSTKTVLAAQINAQCTTNDPLLTITPAYASSTSAIVYEVSLKNQDSYCEEKSYKLNASSPNGVNATLNTSQMELVSGESETTNLTVTPLSASVGNNTISVIVYNDSNSSLATTDVIYNYPSSSNGGGGGGGGLSSSGGSGGGVASKTIKTPSNLFDIKLDIPKDVVIQGDTINASATMLKMQGEGLLDVTLTLTVFDEKRNNVWKESVTVAVMKEKIENILVPTSGLSTGKYHLHALLEYPNAIATAEKTFTVLPHNYLELQSKAAQNALTEQERKEKLASEAMTLRWILLGAIIVIIILFAIIYVKHHQREVHRYLEEILEHMKNTHECKTCGLVFKDYSHFEKHVKSHEEHKEEKKDWGN